MTVSELISELELTAHTLPDGDRAVTRCYVGDLLSWVMTRAPRGCCWVTIMSNINVIAVAELIEAACVVLADGVAPDDELIEAAEQHRINLLTSRGSAFTLCARLSELFGAEVSL